MKNQEVPDAQSILPLLPSVDALLHSPAAIEIQAHTGIKYLTILARGVIEKMRQDILTGKFEFGSANLSKEILLEKGAIILEKLWKSGRNTNLQKVINATGVIIHTNLGRAPLSATAGKAILDTAAGYCNLEYDLETGKRGRRGAQAEKLLAQLTGAEESIIVNNCAAAVFLVLTVLAGGGETIVSRGELVEIGGDFRIPDVMMQSGTVLREIGTTNRTKIEDYEKAINENTRLIAKIHPSNFRVVGFTKAVDVAELAELAHREGLMLYEDAGSGAILDLSAYGLDDEPYISRSIEKGADVVTFSGDKLLGGVQSGLIVGRREIIDELRRHPLYRALRVDKLIYAALEATLSAFLRETAFEEIPVLRMLSQTVGQIRQRTERFAKNLQLELNIDTDLSFKVQAGNSVIGGGSAPEVQPETTLLALTYSQMTAENLERKLRFSNPPVIARIVENKILLDLRTVAETQEPELLGVIVKIDREK